MALKSSSSTLVLTICLLLTACDEFSLLEEFANSSDLKLSLESSTVNQNETIDLYPSGGTAPYSFSTVAEDLFYTSTLGSFSGETYTAGDSIGKILIRLIDDAGESTSAALIIRPPVPTLTAVNPGGDGDPLEIEIQWSYSDSTISGFSLYRSENGGEFTVCANPSSSDTNYLDSSSLIESNTYSYYITAKAGVYESQASTTGSASPN